MHRDETVKIPEAGKRKESAKQGKNDDKNAAVDENIEVAEQEEDVVETISNKIKLAEDKVENAIKGISDEVSEDVEKSADIVEEEAEDVEKSTDIVEEEAEDIEKSAYIDEEEIEDVEKSADIDEEEIEDVEKSTYIDEEEIEDVEMISDEIIEDTETVTNDIIETVETNVDEVAEEVEASFPEFEDTTEPVVDPELDTEEPEVADSLSDRITAPIEPILDLDSDKSVPEDESDPFAITDTFSTTSVGEEPAWLDNLVTRNEEETEDALVETVEIYENEDEHKGEKVELEEYPGYNDDKVDFVLYGDDKDGDGKKDVDFAIPMKKGVVIAIVVILALVAISIIGTFASQKVGEAQRIEAAVAQYKIQIAELEGANDQLKQEISNLQSDKAKMRETLVQISQMADDTVAEVAPTASGTNTDNSSSTNTNNSSTEKSNNSSFFKSDK